MLWISACGTEIAGGSKPAGEAGDQVIGLRFGIGHCGLPSCVGESIGVAVPTLMHHTRARASYL